MLRIWKRKKVWLTAINYWKMKDSNFDIFLWFEVWQKKPLSAQILLTYEFCILQLFTTEVIVTCSIKLSGLALPFMEFQDPGYKMSKIFCIKKNQQAQRKISNFENWTSKPYALSLCTRFSNFGFLSLFQTWKKMEFKTNLIFFRVWTWFLLPV